jgi:hypothetical protein
MGDDRARSGLQSSEVKVAWYRASLNGGSGTPGVMGAVGIGSV